MAKDILFDMRLIPAEHLDIYLFHLFAHDLAGNSIQTAIIQELAGRATEAQKKLIRKKIPHKYQAALDSGEKNDAIIVQNHHLVSSIMDQIAHAHTRELGIRLSSLHANRKPEQRSKVKNAFSGL